MRVELELDDHQLGKAIAMQSDAVLAQLLLQAFNITMNQISSQQLEEYIRYAGRRERRVQPC